MKRSEKEKREKGVEIESNCVRPLERFYVSFQELKNLIVKVEIVLVLKSSRIEWPKNRWLLRDDESSLQWKFLELVMTESSVSVTCRERGIKRGGIWGGKGWREKDGWMVGSLV